jgi:uncharacterized protein (DUF427 family)
VSLTTGRGPLGPDPSGQFSAPVPADVVYVEPYPRRIRALIGDRTVIDTEQAMLVHRPGKPTSYAFPVDDVPVDLAEPEAIVLGHVSVPWDMVDAWYEENVHLAFQSYPKNPYHRVDCLASSRRLRVEIGGAVVVDTTDTTAVYETALAPKLYVSKDAVRMDLLSVNPTSTSWCSYKGHATWWDATVNGVVVANVAWSYEDALPESVAIDGMLSFDEAVANVSADFADRG